MAKPPAYPDDLTKAFWDKKKGIIAKAIGETGVGKACEDAQRAYAAIDWKQFDPGAITPQGSSPEAVKAAEGLKQQISAEHGSKVVPLITALKTLKTKAEAAGEQLAKGKLTKGDAKTATSMATSADQFSIALKLNGTYFTAVGKECDDMLKAKQDLVKMKAAVTGQTGKHLASLLQGVQKFLAAEPDKKLWEEVIKQQGRSVCNGLKADPILNKKYLNTWATKFQGFDWDTIGFGKGDTKSETKTFLIEVVKEAKTLRSDL